MPSPYRQRYKHARKVSITNVKFLNFPQIKWYVNGTEIDTSKTEFNRHTINFKEQVEYRAFSELVITGLKTEDNGKKRVYYARGRLPSFS